MDRCDNLMSARSLGSVSSNSGKTEIGMKKEQSTVDYYSLMLIWGQC